MTTCGKSGVAGLGWFLEISSRRLLVGTATKMKRGIINCTCVRNLPACPFTPRFCRVLPICPAPCPRRSASVVLGHAGCSLV